MSPSSWFESKHVFSITLQFFFYIFVESSFSKDSCKIVVIFKKIFVYTNQGGRILKIIILQELEISVQVRCLVFSYFYFIVLCFFYWLLSDIFQDSLKKESCHTQKLNLFTSDDFLSHGISVLSQYLHLNCQHKM